MLESDAGLWAAIITLAVIAVCLAGVRVVARYQNRRQ